MAAVDHRQAVSSTLEIPEGFLRVCVLAWGRRQPPFPCRTSREGPLGGSLVPLAQDPHGLLALVARRAVEDEDAVEVVHLVLDDPRLETGRLDHDRLAVRITGAHPHVDGALDVHVDAG